MSWVITAVAVGVVALGATAATSYQSVAAAQDAKDQAAILRKKQKTNAQESAFKIQKLQGVQNTTPGLRDTILTGPSGLTGGVGTGNLGGGKALLGQ